MSNLGILSLEAIVKAIRLNDPCKEYCGEGQAADDGAIMVEIWGRWSESKREREAGRGGEEEGRGRGEEEGRERERLEM